jgi:hypothetical protein
MPDLSNASFSLVATRHLRMHFQSQLGQTKVDFNNQGKNAPQRIAFWLEIFLFKIEIACGKKLKRRGATSLLWQMFPPVQKILAFFLSFPNGYLVRR